MKIYLVDFENVKSKGLTGIDSLDENDTVVIFYSENSDTISFEMHQKVLTSKANVQYLKVNVGGKNALDFQLSTLLGYLVANGKYSDIFIISNDRGFDFLHDFWFEKCSDMSNSTVLRMKTIQASVNYGNTKSKTELHEENVDLSDIIESEQAMPIEEISDEIKTVEVTSALRPEQNNSNDEIKVSSEKEQDNDSKNKTQNEQKYIYSLTKLLSNSNCTKNDIQLISFLLIESKTKEEFHNLLAKNFKQQATEFYKLLRPRYLKLKEIYYQENPNALKEIENKSDTQMNDTEEEKNTDKENVIYHDIISSRLAELLTGICNNDDLLKVEECFKTAQTKQQLYIRMVKMFKKEKGCEIYNAVRGEYTNIQKEKQEV